MTSNGSLMGAPVMHSSGFIRMQLQESGIQSQLRAVRVGVADSEVHASRDCASPPQSRGVKSGPQ